MRRIIIGLLVAATPSLPTSATTLTYTDYHLTLDSVYKDLNTLAGAHPPLTNVKSLGASLEGRDIKALKISSNPVWCIKSSGRKASDSQGLALQ